MDEQTTPAYDRLLAAAQDVRAPAALRAGIDAERERLAPRRALRRRFQLTGALAGAAAAAGIVVGLLVPGGGPTVLEAAALAVKPAVAAAPAPDPSYPATLPESVGGVRFPAWGPRLHWTASGTRTDQLDGRRARTVFYDGPRGTRVGYTIVDGKALPWPNGSRTVVRRGVEIHVLRHGGRRVVAWRVDGHSCVLSAPGSVPESRLVELASVSTYG
jgi:hypothetical protein